MQWYTRGPNHEVYVLEGKPDLNGVIWKVGWDGKGLERTSVTVAMVHSYWVDPSQDPQGYFDVSPDGRHVAVENQSVLSANIGKIHGVR